MTYSKRVAILATGDEIKNGDILNTNSQAIAECLFSQGILPGAHMSVGDVKEDITEAINYLLQNHEAIIITGGLGPTSDDLTRYALADAFHKKLIFDEVTWNTIVERLKNFGFNTPPESNKQQALFPETSIIIPNPNGTAAGCSMHIDTKWIFMLPGPPAECLPMLQHNVLPILFDNQFQETLYFKRWFLFGVSEGEIAETLDNIAKPYRCTTGYRICYPYIEFKIYSQEERDFLTLCKKIQEVIQPYIVDDGKVTASDKLKHMLPSLPYTITLDDFATGGMLQNTLLNPHTYSKLVFHSKQKSNECHVTINGLEEFWHNKTSKMTTIKLSINNQDVIQEIPLRGIRVKQYAVEWICMRILELLLVCD